VDDLLFASGIDPMHIKRAALHDIESAREFAFAEEVFAFLEGFNDGNLSDMVEIDVGEAAKELAASQRICDSNLLELGEGSHEVVRIGFNQAAGQK
jgi:hypothetical protein